MTILKFKPFSEGNNYHAEIDGPRGITFDDREKDAAWLIQELDNRVASISPAHQLVSYYEPFASKYQPDSPRSFFRTEPEDLVPNNQSISATRERQTREREGMAVRIGLKSWKWAF